MIQKKWLIAYILLLSIACLSRASAASTKDIYDFYCVSCHGSQGNGRGVNTVSGGLTVEPRDHSNAGQMKKLSDDEIALAIAKGGDAVEKSELMPPWNTVLSEQQIQDLVRYLRQLCQCQYDPTAAKTIEGSG